MQKILKQLNLEIIWKKDGITATRRCNIDIPWLQNYTKDINEDEIIGMKVSPICESQ